MKGLTVFRSRRNREARPARSTPPGPQSTFDQRAADILSGQASGPPSSAGLSLVDYHALCVLSGYTDNLSNAEESVATQRLVELGY